MRLTQIGLVSFKCSHIFHVNAANKVTPAKTFYLLGEGKQL